MNAMHPITQAVAWALIHFLWQGALLGALLWMTLSFLVRRRPETRYVVACTGLGLMALAPMITLALLWPKAGGTVSLPPKEALATAVELGWMAQVQGFLAPWLDTILFVWCAGAGLLAMRLSGGLWMVHRLKTEGTTPAPSEWHLVLSRLSRALGVRRSVRLLRSTKVEVPMVAGWIRPIILLPVAAFTQLTPAQLEAVLAHELAHIRRHDFLVNLMQAGIETLLFYHPAVWWLSSRIREERELCCDDTAVGLCKDALEYARALALLETHRPLTPSLALSTHGGPLMRRIHRLLQPQLLPMPRLRNFIFMGLALSAFGASAYALQDKPEPQVRDIKVIEAGKRFSMRSEGEVKLQPDEKAPVVAGKDGKFRLSEKKEGKARRYEVEGDKQTYTVDGKEQPLDAEGEAWIRNSLKDVEKMRVDSKTMAIHVGEMNADAMKAHEMAIEAQKEARRVQVEVKEDGPHRKRIIVMRDGKVETENVVETPEVEVKQEGEGKQHIIVKKGGKVERDEVIVIPKVKILREGNHQRVIVEKDGKIVEDHEMELPGFDGMEFMKPKAWKMEGFGNGEHFKMLSPRNASEVAALRQQVEALQRQVEQLQRQLGQTPKATPKPSPAPKPTSTPAPTPKP